MSSMWMLSIWLACGARRAPEPSAEERVLQSIDQEYALRQDPKALDRSIQATLDALSKDPDNIAYLMRASRGFSARALTRAGEAEQRSDLETARSYGLLCLATNSNYSVQLNRAGGQIVRKAVRQLGPADVPCIEQTTIAWVRWMELRGPAGLIDANKISLYAAQLTKLQPDGWVGPWAMAMVGALPQAEARAGIGETGQHFAQARKAEPRLAEIRLDEIQYQLPYQGEEGVDAALRGFALEHARSQDGRWGLENDKARSQAEGMEVEALMSRVWKPMR